MRRKILFFCFSITTSLSGLALTFDADVDPAVRTQFLADLEYLSTLKSDGNQGVLNKEIFGSSSGSAYAQWFLKRVGSVGKSLCFGEPAVACVLSAWEKKIWLAPTYSQFNQPQIARLMVLLHEARHTEAHEKFWPHVRCPAQSPLISIWSGTPLAGEMACETSVYGSYGIATVFLKNIARHCVNCHAAVKADALRFAHDQALRQRSPADQQKLLAE